MARATVVSNRRPKFVVIAAVIPCHFQTPKGRILVVVRTSCRAGPRGTRKPQHAEGGLLLLPLRRKRSPELWFARRPPTHPPTATIPYAAACSNTCKGALGIDLLAILYFACLICSFRLRTKLTPRHSMAVWQQDSTRQSIITCKYNW